MKILTQRELAWLSTICFKVKSTVRRGKKKCSLHNNERYKNLKSSCTQEHISEYSWDNYLEKFKNVLPKWDI